MDQANTCLGERKGKSKHLRLLDSVGEGKGGMF